MWERLQASLYADFEEDYLAILKSSVATVTDTGASVIVDPHNFARYNGTLVTGPDLADLWSRLARIYGNNSQVVFGLVNEPHGIDAAAWFAIAQQAADAIRATGADNLILVPGNCYTQAEVWTSGLCDSGGLFTANGAAALAFHDPNFAFEMHQYYDIGFGGTDATCLWDASLVLSSATTWLRENSRRGFLGETGVSSSAACLATLQEALTLLDDNSDVWMGYTYWAAGSGWGDYFMSVESTSNSTDNAIFDILAEHPGLL
ncbi:hypothetical protein HK405_006042 [Cladochytrium tenue]|nr:hypothetical protein HK405_006042 [Cladochytrium tenue]